MKFNGSIICIVFMTYTIVTQSTSKYNGVSWNEKKNLWQVEFDINGKKRKAYFEDEFDAAKKLNKLCEKMGMLPQNPGISETPNKQKKKKTSQYKGVNWYKEGGKWYVQVHLKGKKKYGGHFKSELDAAKRVNQLCEELGIPPLKPTINTTPNEQYQAKEKTSQYKGVTYDKQTGKWCVRFSVKGQDLQYGGQFNEEIDAGKRVNQLCKDFGIPQKNPTISAIPKQLYQKKGKTSQYKGVCWHTQSKRWRVKLCIKGHTVIGGSFKHELDAAKRVNQLCEELGIPLQNPAIPNEQYQHDDCQAITNPVNIDSSEILQTDNDDAKQTKRKRSTECNTDVKLPYYFY